eukprot:Tbor_TRINITY_DN5943_c0_g1::TRINITY_DN5943_c0_g1_i11::g.19214::m.19214/K03469/rnhA, RNASEH1; ribonuclease HI
MVVDKYCSTANFVVATDGSCKEVQLKNRTVRHCTSVFAMWFNNPTTLLREFIDSVSRNAGPWARSYRAEQLAILDALKSVQQLGFTLHQQGRERPPTVAIITDSQSMLQSLALGPLRQKNYCNNEMWKTLNDIPLMGIQVTFVFVYSHCGQYENDVVDKIAGTCYVMTTHPPRYQ